MLALAAFYTVMEEISWGQRLFGIESPAFFAERNTQGETNLHNFLTGPESTRLKDLVEYTLASALIGYGLLYPLALRLGWAPALWFDQLGAAAPPLYLCIFFVNAAVFEVGWLSFNEAEVAEIFVGTALVLMLVHYFVGGAATIGPARLDPMSGRRCAAMSLAGFALLGVLAVVTTTGFQALPGRAEATERRLANGYEKFARRLLNYNRWEQAADLYLRAYELEPDKAAHLQEAMDIYEASGDTAGYRRTKRLLLDATAAQVSGDDAGVKHLLMLAMNYADIDASELAAGYLDQALATAKAQVAGAPETSESHFWLGRAHQQRGEYESARQAYQQALTLEPGRGRYVLALRLLNKQMDSTGPTASTPD